MSKIDKNLNELEKDEERAQKEIDRLTAKYIKKYNIPEDTYDLVREKCKTIAYKRTERSGLNKKVYPRILGILGIILGVGGFVAATILEPAGIALYKVIIVKVASILMGLLSLGYGTYDVIDSIKVHNFTKYEEKELIVKNLELFKEVHKQRQSQSENAKVNSYDYKHDAPVEKLITPKDKGFDKNKKVDTKGDKNDKCFYD
jgi:hypothetical protein